MTLKQKIIYSQNIIEKAVFDYQNIFMSYSSGKDSTVLLDLVYKIKPNILVISIDTTFEYQETLNFTNKIVAKYNLNHKYIRPIEEDKQRIKKEYDNEVIKDGKYICCKHKEPTISKFLSENKFDAWITGLRHEETPERKFLPIFQLGDLVKVNPIIFWDEEEIWQYIKDNNLEYHPFYDKNYKSLGCKICTEAGFREGRANQGKFEQIGVSLECGLHLSNG